MKGDYHPRMGAQIRAAKFGYSYKTCPEPVEGFMDEFAFALQPWGTYLA